MKFIFHNHPGFGHGPSSVTKPITLERTHSHSTHSTTADDEDEEDHGDSKSPLQDTPTRPRRHVRFGEVVTVIQDDAVQQPHPQPQLDVNTCWYTRQDIANFCREAFATAEQFVTQEEEDMQLEKKESLCTSYILGQAYRGFCRVKTFADMVEVLNQTPPTWTLSIDAIGLDRCIVSEIGQDRQERRKRIVRQVTAAQQLFTYDIQQRQGKVRQVSRTISQPSRLYAYYVAQLVARSSRHSNES